MFYQPGDRFTQPIQATSLPGAYGYPEQQSFAGQGMQGGNLQYPPPKYRSKEEDIGPAMQKDNVQWTHITDQKERRRRQNVLAQRKYRKRKAAAVEALREALRAAKASGDSRDSSPGYSSSLTMDGLEGRRSQEGSVISAASPNSSAWSERRMTVENSLMAQLLNLPEPPTLPSSRSQSYYPIACSSLNRSVTTSQHCPNGRAQLEPGTPLPLEDQYNCEIDPTVSNFAGQFSGNVDFGYQILGGGNSRYS